MKVGSIGALRAAWTVAAFVLTACGGGGGGGSGNAPPPPPPAPTATISAAATSIQEGESTQLTWSSSNATTCVASGGWTGNVATSGTQSTGALAASTTFSLSCSGPGGSAPANVTVTVNPIPPSLSMQATSRILRGTQTSTLTWSGVKLSSCQASGDWSGSRPTSGSETVGPFVQAALLTYSLHCVATTGLSVAAFTQLQYRTGTNQPPVANAGPDLIVGSANRVELSSSSSDDGQLESSSWTQTGGTPVTLGPGFSPANASFIAPTVTADTVLTFELTVVDDEGLSSAPDAVNVTVKPIPPSVTISGDVQYERVSLGPPGQGWSYADQNYQTISEVFVEVLNAATQTVIASGTFLTDFEFTVPSQTDLVLRATARTSRQAPRGLPHWEISVRDLDANGAPLADVYSYTGPAFNSHAGGRFSLRIPSGWNSAGQLVGPRAAAPFAILDTLHLMLRRLDSPQPDLPPLTIDWAPGNRGGETFYSTSGGAHRIVLSGEVDVDTDEYDTAVILHEMSHYILNTVSRDESIGGQHAFGDRLDMRVAFSEGFATAFGALISGQAMYEDTFGPGQGDSSFFSLDADQTLNEGWFSEFSVQEILYDFGRWGLWQALHQPMQQTDALTSAFALFSALREADPSRASFLASLLANEDIVGPTIDDFGSTETNNAGSVDVLPIYTPIALGGTVQLRSTNVFGTVNKLSNHRYLRLSLPATTNVRFQVSAAAGRDADIMIFLRGVPLGPPQGPANEDFSVLLNAGDYVLDVFECGNAGCNSNVVPGPTDITVSVSAN